MPESAEESRRTLAAALDERSATRNPARENVWLAVLWLVAGVLLLLAFVRLLRTGPDALLNAHPASVVIWAAAALLGLVAVLWAGATCVAALRRPTEPARSRSARRHRLRRWWLSGSMVALVLALVLAGAVAWSKPMPAEPVALAALTSDDEVQVRDRLLWYELAPTPPPSGPFDPEPTQEEEAEGQAKVGLIFSPGARVDPRAYAALLRPLAARGSLVVVLKKPLGLAVLDPQPPDEIISGHTEIDRWIVGGHSLGGTVAASFADDEPKVSGLLLLASWPARTVERPDLPVLSVTGSADGLATPADIEETRHRLPEGTAFHVVEGAVHSDFGDYGEQPGDGERGVDKSSAQDEIRGAMAEFLTGFQ